MPLSLVVLDGGALNPGDLDWRPLAGLGSLTVYDNSRPDQVVARARDAEILFTNKVVLSADTLAQLPKLKYIGVLATGVNVVDLDAARERGIPVTNVPGYGPGSVAQMAFAHLLHHVSRVAQHDTAVKAGQWSASDQFCFWNAPLTALEGKTLGVVGFGDIGQALARMARGFDMQVLINTTRRRTDLPEGCRWVERAELFAQSDVVSLHCPLTPETDQFINADLLATMKSSAVLINTARGGLVNEAELAEALARGTIAGAGLDVLSTEPPCPDNPLLSAPNCSVTPHNAWATLEARQNLLNIVVANLQGFLSGRVHNRVN